MQTILYIVTGVDRSVSQSQKSFFPYFPSLRLVAGLLGLNINDDTNVLSATQPQSDVAVAKCHLRFVSTKKKMKKEKKIHLNG